MSSDTAISIRGLSKAYTIKKGGLEKQSTLVETAMSRARNPFKRAEKEQFYALTDINLDVKKGEVVGLIGRNGAGKSTLLKVLSRITYPTSGEVDIFGRVGSLLEVGTGFHPELTGKENIFLNGTILGMTRPEIKSVFDPIVQFAGVEQFLETPVKRYSSGMRVRLAFSVAAHLRTEVLIVDEVLAVGDIEFQKKCLGKMQDVTSTGDRTVILVSHNMDTIQTICDNGILLENGKTTLIGPTDEAVDAYLKSGNHLKCSKFGPDNHAEYADNRMKLIGGSLIGHDQRQTSAVRFGEPFAIKMDVDVREEIVGGSLSIRIFDQRERLVTVANTVGLEDEYRLQPGTWHFTCELPMNVMSPGEYRVDIGGWIRGGGKLFTLKDALNLGIDAAPFDRDHRFNANGSPLMSLPCRWSQAPKRSTVSV